MSYYDIKKVRNSYTKNEQLVFLDHLIDVFQAYNVGSLNLQDIFSNLVDWFLIEEDQELKTAILEVLRESTNHPEFPVINIKTFMEKISSLCSDEEKLIVIDILSYRTEDDVIIYLNDKINDSNPIIKRSAKDALEQINMTKMLGKSKNKFTK